MALTTIKHAARKTFTAIEAPKRRRDYLARANEDVTDVPRILLANVAAMRNLGDHAITLGELAFLRHYFPQYPVVELNSVEWSRMNGLPRIPKAIKNVKAVLLQGGGHMGTLWAGGEEAKAMGIISAAEPLPCAYFPQTAYYADDVAGRNLLDSNRGFYRNHSRVFFCLRDRRSFDFLKSEFPFVHDRMLYTPDIALFIEDPLPSEERQGITLCMRSDQEKVTAADLPSQIESMCDELGLSHHRTDTVAPDFFPMSEREQKVHDKFLEFKRSELVITDRLHAMIFCAITHTPCLAMNNINGKVAGVYEWIKQFGFIRLVMPENIDKSLINEMRSTDTNGYPSTRELLKPRFDTMAQQLGSFLNL